MPLPRDRAKGEGYLRTASRIAWAGVAEWQTRQTQNLLSVRTWGFKSLHPHQTAMQLGAISFDAVKQLVLARIERRPARLDLTRYPYLPTAEVRTTAAADYAALLSRSAA